jgi:predicted extracellular nuclease
VIDSGNVQDEASSTPTPAAYQTKLGAIASILALGAPDIVALQEVENEAALADLASRPELPKPYPYRALLPGNDPRGIDVAVMSTLPLGAVISHEADFFTGSTSGIQKYHYSRDCLEVHIPAGNLELVLLVVHFKAKSSDDPMKRLAEAEHTRGIADAITAGNPSAVVLILGDFNDFPGSPPIAAIEGTGDAVYSSAALLVAAADAWTTQFNGVVQLHDDQRASPKLTVLRDASSATILHDEAFPSDVMKNASDHAPVVSTYVFP